MTRGRAGADDTRPILQIHIPKTAGTSLRVALLPGSRETQHIVAARIPVDVWERSYSFAFVRNPYDRAVSMFRYHTGAKYRGSVLRRHPDLHDLTFDQYLERFIVPQESDLFVPQVRYLVHPESRRPVDFIGRFESLEQDFGRLTAQLGMRAELPHRLGLPKADWTSFFTDERLSIVSEVYAQDFAQLGYQSIGTVHRDVAG